MMRVLHIVSAGEIGGAERMLGDLVRNRENHSIAILSPNPGLRALVKSFGVRVYDKGEGKEGALQTLRSAFGDSDVAFFSSAIAQAHADIVHLHTFGSQVVGTRAALRTGARVVRTEHSTRVYDDPSCWPFSRWSLARTDRVVCISDHIRSHVLSRAPRVREKLSVVYNGVDVERFSERPLLSPSPGAPFRFAMVGRLDTRKGVDLAIQALARVPEAHLDIVGDGDQREALAALAERLGVPRRVTFHGFVSDPRPILAKADACLSSSRTEGLGIALLEAMASGVAVVALPTGGIPEYVIDSVTGFLAHGQGEAALVREMQRALSQRARLPEIGRAARKLVCERFSVGAMRAGYDEVYRSLAP